MDWGALCRPSFGADFWFALLSIIVVNIIMSGDNAIGIALAVRFLSGKQRFQGMLLGVGLAVLLRIGLTFFCAKLLEVSFLKAVGGALIAWIAVKLLVEGMGEERNHKEVHTLRKAVATILIADLAMSADNVLAVAGACKGDTLLLVFGLGSSIPLVIFGSGLLLRLMEKYPIIITVGAAVLGRVAGDLIISDAFIVRTLHPSVYVNWAVQAVFTLGVVAAGKLWVKQRPAMSPE